MRHAPQRSKTPRQTQDKDHDGGPILALSGLSRARHDGLYRTLGTLTTSSMAGRDCLPATHSDSATHARRAHAYRELQNTSSMHLRHASGSTLQHPRSSSRHANKACMCSAHAPWLLRTPQTMRAPSFPRPLQMPDARSAVSAPEHKQGTGMRCERGRAPRAALQGRLRHPSARPPSAGSDAPDQLVPLGAPLSSLGPNLRKTGRTRSSGVEGEFEGSSIGLSSHQHRTA